MVLADKGIYRPLGTSGKLRRNYAPLLHRRCCDKPFTSYRPYRAANRPSASGGSPVWRKALTQLKDLRERRDAGRPRSIGVIPIGVVVALAIVCVVVAVLTA